MSILGEDTDFELVGGYGDDDVNAIVGAVIGALRGRAPGHMARGGQGRRHAGGLLKGGSFSSPSWRSTELAPGVNTADEGLEPLPFIPQQNGGVFNAANVSIIYQGQIQKPFRGERWIASVVRTGTTATGLLLAQLFVGTSLQQADITGIDIQQLGNPQGFGLRMAMFQATPGVLVRLPITVSTAPTGSDTIFLSLFCMGRVIHS